MKKKLLLILLLIVSVTTLAGCSKKQVREEALAVKNEYEVLNGKETSNGKTYRTITIDDDNPYIKVTPQDIVNKIDANETFYLYVGDSMCPWCRSNIESAIKAAKDNNIKDIYYIDIWDDDHNEILRDVYKLEDSKKGKKVVKSQDGTEEYNRLLKEFDSVLKDYTLSDEDDVYEVGEKRIYAPNYFYIVDGKVVKFTNGRAQTQEDAWGELSDEQRLDQYNQFNELFSNN